MTTSAAHVRNASEEAGRVAGPEWQARVLEPSPPAVVDGDWFADDPVAPDPGSDRPPLVPTGLGDDGVTDWSSWLTAHPDVAGWVGERWLGGPRQLASPPAGLVETRLALHRLAAYVIAPVRHRANGKFGLRWTLGGFGTPFFGQDRQIRIVGDVLVDQQGDSVRSRPISTLAAAAEFLNTEIDTEPAAEHDSPPVGDLDEPLAVDPAAADYLGNWFGMGFAALETLRADPDSVSPSRPQLWPGHFDPAIEVGDEDHRASYGASPGDQTIVDPYLYVSIWWPDRLGVDTNDPVWNAPSFTGAILPVADFPAGDPATAAADFFSSIRDRIEQR